MKLYKIYQLRPYGKFSLEEWRKLSLEQATKLKSELEQLNPDDIFIIEE
jgi:hypothetical protein